PLRRGGPGIVRNWRARRSTGAEPLKWLDFSKVMSGKFPTRWAPACLAFGSLLLLCACGPLARPSYTRTAGRYTMPDPSLTPTPVDPAALTRISTGDAPLRKAAE